MSPERPKWSDFDAEMAAPDEAALHVERDELTVAEPRIDTFAVGDRRGRGEVVFLVGRG